MKDKGTIFNPVMYMVLLILTVQLLMLFLCYKKMSWLSDTMTHSMTDALLGACTLNEEELYQYGRTNQLEIIYPREKYDAFKSMLREELGLTADMEATATSVPSVLGEVVVSDFRVYSVYDKDITLYDFAEDGSYQMIHYPDMAGTLTLGNGEVVESTALLAEISFKVDFLGVPIGVKKYHMVDVVR